MYHHKSGALKRKERVDKQQKALSSQQTLSSLGFVVTQPLDKPCSSKETSSQQGQSATDSVTTENIYQASDSAPSDSEEETVHHFSESDTNSTVVPSDDPEIVAERQTDSDADIGLLEAENPSAVEVEAAVRLGPGKFPTQFPCDSSRRSFPLSVLKTKLKNGESVPRDWLVWSKSKQSLFCFPCRLFSKLPPASRSNLVSQNGYTRERWRKLHEKIAEHESTVSHKLCYVQWRQMEKNLIGQSTVDELLMQNIKSQTEQWRQILRRLLDVTMFLGERGLAFRGNSHLVGDPGNGNFLGILELIGRYDPVMADHLAKVKDSQTSQQRLQVHYLSADSQNEFIYCCASKVMAVIMDELDKAKYYSIIVDATPDSAHVEQTVFVVRYVHLSSEGKYEVHERFLEFVDCNKKTGEAIAQLIVETLQKHSIPLSNYRGQGYDNGSNMSGSYKGAQAVILKQNPLATFAPCA